jgi:hypothetical protein
MEFAGEFETHITVHLQGNRSVAELREWGAKRQLKCIHIELARGKVASQPMLSRRGNSTLSSELALAIDLAEDLTSDGFIVARIKIEASPSNAEIPRSKEESAAAGGYFEHHVKVLFESESSLEELVQLVEPHTAHLSNNALAVRPDGRQERFVTQRVKGVGRPEAAVRLARLLDVLKGRNLQILDVEEEFVVYDSNLNLDAGWISP